VLFQRQPLVSRLPVVVEALVAPGIVECRWGFKQAGALLVNESWDVIIDENAAAAALKSGKPAGLGIDASEEEPPLSSPLLAINQVVATPHTGTHTRRRYQRCR